ncbi:unnamed protein product [Discosporangium mesarthrocarpum]
MGKLFVCGTACVPSLPVGHLRPVVALEILFSNTVLVVVILYYSSLFLLVRYYFASDINHYVISFRYLFIAICIVPMMHICFPHFFSFLFFFVSVPPCCMTLCCSLLCGRT